METDTDTLLRVILALVAVWLALVVIERFVDVLASVLAPVSKLLVIAVLALIVLSLLDRL
jgi:hypothetical protein